MGFFSGIIILLLSFSLLGPAWGETYPISFEYSRPIKFSNLQKKIGPILGIAPFRDQRSEKLYMGRYTSPRHATGYFTSEPISLEKAIQESLSKAVIHSGVETTPILEWDGKSESMKDMNADSVLMIVIKRFWVEGRVVSLRTKMHASIHLVTYLGKKKLGKVFTQNVFIEKNKTFGTLSSQEVAQWLHRTLADTLDAFLRNPY
jgi:hypothetical protein